MIRTLRLSLAVLALALSASIQTAHAQAAVYGMFTVNRLSGLQSSPLAISEAAPASASSVFKDSVNPSGFTGGIFYDFKTYGPVRLGVDLRGATAGVKRGAEINADGAGAHLYSALAGIRGTFHTPKPYIKPYAQVSAGLGRSNYGLLNNATTSQYVLPGVQLQSGLEYHGYVGTDLSFAPWGDWRVFELGAGALNSFGNASHTYPILSVSTGVVLHFPNP